jgi:prepilin-type N-terminal cleavage/methylation domain-containing protein
VKRSSPTLVRLRSASPRRGVTLVEMLVTVAVLVIIMTILVQIFQAATGAVTAAQAYQQLDDQLRRLDGMIRGDLEGVTARFTPPLDPVQNLGYFEYIENEFADNQGEDSDDCLRFTAKAPPDRPFTGRMWVTAPQPPNAAGFYNSSIQPVTITSDYAEIIYFLRNGNLYRRVLLIAPELQSAIVPTISNQAYFTTTATGVPFQPSIFNGTLVSWQGVNDLSARPSATGPNQNVSPSLGTQAQQTIRLNTLGDLTNRENRFASPRIANDFYDASTGTSKPDGIPDDRNGDNVPDYYASLYFGVFNASSSLINSTTQLINEPGYPNVPRTGGSFATMAFPWVFPGAYSYPQLLTNDQVGWIHSPTPVVNDLQGATYQFDTNAATYLANLNHNPLDVGDNLSIPNRNTTTTGYYSPTQTWWGFPTWRETLSPNWTDPTVQVNVQVANGATPVQPNGLSPRAANGLTGSGQVQDDANLLPPMAQPPQNWPTALSFSIIRQVPQLFSDTWGETSLFMGGQNVGESGLWSQSWEDDLILTGVRSFDVKAYDNALSNYADLGWGDDPRITANLAQPFLGTGKQTPYLFGNFDVSTNSYNSPTYGLISASAKTLLTDIVNQTFAHEGRMPPISSDYRLDAQFGAATNYLPATSTYLVGNKGTYNNGNVGDDNPGVIRLRRVWDSWSTNYSRAPGTGVATSGFPVGPPFSPPVYPSYPPPYPAPLRGIQIQIRVADPTNQRIKSLTIRQDFTDKL